MYIVLSNWAPIAVSQSLIAGFGLYTGAKHLYRKFKEYLLNAAQPTNDTRQPILAAEQELSAYPMRRVYDNPHVSYTHDLHPPYVDSVKNEDSYSDDEKKKELANRLQQHLESIYSIAQTYMRQIVGHEQLQTAFLNHINTCISISKTYNAATYQYTIEDYFLEVNLANDFAQQALNLKRILTKEWADNLRPLIQQTGQDYQNYFMIIKSKQLLEFYNSYSRNKPMSMLPIVNDEESTARRHPLN